jgi:hypothetical protein
VIYLTIHRQSHLMIICSYIHPSAFLTQTYITNILLSMPFDDDPSVHGSQRTSHAIKNALADTTTPSSSKGASTSSGTTEIVVFGRATGDASPNGTALRLVVARISLSPPALRTPDLQRRLPRPDDPTPRRPPLLYFGAKRPREVSGGSVFGDPAPSSKKAKSDPALLVVGKVPTEQDREAQRRARDVMLGLHRSSSVSSSTSSRAGSVAPTNSKLDRKASAGDPFKVPNLPSARKGKERGGASTPLDAPSPSSELNPYEEVNKLVRLPCASSPPSSADVRLQFVKRTVVLLLAKRGVHKHTHPEYADVYSHVYRGSAFALVRASMNGTSPVLTLSIAECHEDTIIRRTRRYEHRRRQGSGPYGSVHCSSGLTTCFGSFTHYTCSYTFTRESILNASFPGFTRSATPGQFESLQWGSVGMCMILDEDSSTFDILA